jgi:hypothetical protein
MKRPWKEPENLRWNRIAAKLADRREKAMRDPDIATNDPDRAKLIRLNNRYTAAVARGDSVALGLVSSYN